MKRYFRNLSRALFLAALALPLPAASVHQAGQQVFVGETRRRAFSPQALYFNEVKQPLLPARSQNHDKMRDQLIQLCSVNLT